MKAILITLDQCSRMIEVQEPPPREVRTPLRNRLTGWESIGQPPLTVPESIQTRIYRFETTDTHSLLGRVALYLEVL